MNTMVSIIIPVLNEGSTIRKVIRIIRQTTLPIEIIVVDDNSSDNTIAEAMKESVRIVTSSRRGKGLSMREGLLAARHDVIVYLDGDITTYPSDIVDLLAGPILSNEADFVKSTFKRQAGRVTQLVAKPLLSILFPELSHLEQPLSGMIAGKKSYLEQVHFEKDYGVDIGLLIDMHRMGARILEVNIGKVQNAMQNLEQLGKMSKEVSRTILNKANALGDHILEKIGQIDLINRQMESAVLESIEKMEKIVLFEMDHVVLSDNFTETAASRKGLSEGLGAVRLLYSDPKERIRATAALFRDKSLPCLLEIVDAMPLVPGICELLRELKKRGYSCGLVSEQFSFVANHLKNTLGFDFVLSNQMKLEHGLVTGEVVLAPFFTSPDDKTSYNKSSMFSHIHKRLEPIRANVIYVTADKNDQECLDLASIGYHFDGSDILSLLDHAPGKKNNARFALSSFRPQKPSQYVLPVLVLTAVSVFTYYTFLQKDKKNPPLQAG